MTPAPNLTLPIAWPRPGRYLMAISGGADSMALLDLMTDVARDRGYQLVVAHFDHGLRPDAADDRRLVQSTAARHDLPFEYCEAHLPARSSEATARAARYAWLHTVAKRHQATIVTAHHQDDLIETSLLNLARGSGRRGLAPMQPSMPTSRTPDALVVRPLLAVSRHELRDYATTRHLVWHEDPTNTDLTNPRNFLRHRLLAAATSEWRARYLQLLARLSDLNPQIEHHLTSILAAAPAAPLLTTTRTDPNTFAFDPAFIRSLSLPELEELLLAAARRLEPTVEISQRNLRELALFAKTASPRHRRPLTQTLWLVRTRDQIILQRKLSISRVY